MLLVLGSASSTPQGLWRARGEQAAPGRSGQGLVATAIGHRGPPSWSHAAILRPGGGESTGVDLWRVGEGLAKALSGPVALLLEAEPITERLSVEPELSAGRAVQCLVFSNPAAGADDEFNAWYSNRHLQDVLRVPGYRAAQRFRIRRQAEAPSVGWSYLALYEVAADSYEAATNEIARRAGTPEMPISPAAQRPLPAHFRPQAWWGVGGA